MLKIGTFSVISTVLALLIMPTISAIAQKKDLNSFHLALGPNQTTAKVMGSTGGSYSLASIVNQDHYGNHCMGYGDPEPDHTMILDNDFASLKLKVNSGGKDTTLVVRSINRKDIRCGFGQQHTRDAVIDGNNWKAGRYEIWVGSMQPHQRSNYSLSVEQ